MTRINKKNILYAVCAVLMIVAAYYFRVIHVRFDNPIIKMFFVLMRSVIQVSLVIGWCWSVRKRILKKQIRQYLIAVGILLALWLILRTCKWEFIAEGGSHLGRYLWYAYYIPMIFVPLLGIFIVDHIGKADDYKTPNRLKYMFIPAALLVTVIFTNDLHNLVFLFPNGYENCELDCVYNVLYYIIIAWFVLLGVYFVVMLMVKCRVPGSKSFQKLPAVILGISMVFWILYVLDILGGDLAAVDCFVIMALLESAIQSGLIPSNTNYNELFQTATVLTQIVDDNYQLCMISATATELSEDVLRKAEDTPVDLGDTILHSKAITGGHVLWQDDVTQIGRLIEELRITQEKLAENNELLRTQLELKETRARTEEKTRLYDRIAKEVAPQLGKAEALLNLAESDPRQGRPALAKVAVLCAYIKRRGNLLLLGEESNTVSSLELEYCIRESLDNLRLGNVFTSFDSECFGKIELEQAVAVFDFYESIAEEFFDNVTAMMVRLKYKDGMLRMQLQIGCAGEIAENSLSGLTALYGDIEWDIQDEDVTVTLSITEGGNGR